MKLFHHYSLICISLIITIAHNGYVITGEQHPLKPVIKHATRFLSPIDHREGPSPMQLFNHNFDKFCLVDLDSPEYMSALRSRCQSEPKLLRKFAIKEKKAKKRKREIEKHVQNSKFAAQIRADLQIKAAAFLLSHKAIPTAPLLAENILVENNELTQNAVSTLLSINSATPSHHAVSKSLTRRNRQFPQNIQALHTRTCLPPKRFRDMPANHPKQSSSRTKKQKIN